MERRISNIVIGVADTQTVDPHLPAAVELAEQLGATLHVAHGYYLPDPTLHPYPEASALAPAALRHLREGAQERLQRQVRRAAPNDGVRARAVPGPPEVAISRVVDEVDADLVLVGSTRFGKIGQLFLGTTAQRVLRGSKVPVLVMRGSEAHPPRRVLFTTDMSQASASAIETGQGLLTQLAGETGYDQRFLLVLGYDLIAPPPLSRNALAEAAIQELRRFVDGLEGQSGQAEVAIRVGEPAHEIRDEATEWQADLVVLGTHGRSGVPRLLIGSVAESVVRQAPCNVLVIPPGATDEDEGD